MIKIPVGKKFALIDEGDYELVKDITWTISTSKVRRTCYAQGYKDKKHLLMHRLILGFPTESTDHINGNGLDNRKSNLRVCRQMDNLKNRRTSKLNKSGYKGVYWASDRNKWRALIYSDRKKYELGRFNTKEEAAKAYDEAAKKLHGKFALLNFP